MIHIVYRPYTYLEQKLCSHENNLFNVTPDIRICSLVEFKFPSRIEKVKWEEQRGSRLTHAPPTHIPKQAGPPYDSHSFCEPEPRMNLDLATQVYLDQPKYNNFIFLTFGHLGSVSY